MTSDNLVSCLSAAYSPNRVSTSTAADKIQLSLGVPDSTAGERGGPLSR